MKKLSIILLLTLSVLTACQSSPDNPRKSADQEKDERAAAASKVSIEVKDPNNTNPTVVEDMMGFVITKNGLTPNSLNMKPGMTLMIYNDLDQAADLYTTTDGEKPCSSIGASLQLKAKETRNIKLTDAMECTVMNQFNTSQKVNISVK